MKLPKFRQARATFAAALLPLLFLLALPASAAVADFTYSTSDNQITITGYTGPDGAVTILDTIDGLPVTRIGNAAFRYRQLLTSVTIPNSVISIESGAFVGCTGLSVITVEALNTFYSSVDGVLFDKSQTTLFQYPGGKTGSYTIPNGVTSIGSSAFSDCVSVASVAIPNSVTSIGNFAFTGCVSLTSVTIPDSVTSIGDWTFEGCVSLASATIGNSITSIGNGGFARCESLTSVAIPDSVTRIGRGAFQSCASLASVTIPSSVTSIGDSTPFAGGAFAGCASLISVTIPNRVTRIEAWTFEGCTGLTSVMIGNGVTFIGTAAFSDCMRLTSVAIGDSVTFIGSVAFLGCTSLTSVTIGNGVTFVGEYSFQDCTSLKGVYFKGNAPGIGSDVFTTSSDKAVVYYLPGTTGWGSTFADRPALLWNPQAFATAPNFGVRAGQFGFTVTGTPGISVIIEATPSLTNPTWTPLSTNTLTAGSSHFTDPQWANHSTRIYRLRSP